MEIKLFFIILFFLIALVKSNKEPEDSEQIIMNIYYQEESGNYTLIESKSKDEDSIAYAIYNKSYERTGLDFLAISSYDKNDNKYDDSKKAYAMGYLEGYLTKDRIYSYYINLLHYSFYDNNLTVPENLKEFFKTKLPKI